ncbi:MAG: hypothetical protein GXY54_02470 [Deltaproteobacteria bacterium]|nr:hypothetical protein [Deltaproteobacteria bacterium]
MLGKWQNKIHGLQNAMERIGGRIAKERSFPVTDRLVNLLLARNLDRLSKTVGAKIEHVETKSAPDGVNITGKVIKSDVTADFFLKALPLEPIWLKNNHQVRFRVVENDLVIDRRDVRGLLASLGNCIFGAVTGRNLLKFQLHCLADENGVIGFGLDGLDKRLDQAMGLLRLTRITPMEGRIVVAGSLNLKNVFAAR